MLPIFIIVVFQKNSNYDSPLFIKKTFVEKVLKNA